MRGWYIKVGPDLKQFCSSLKAMVRAEVRVKILGSRVVDVQLGKAGHSHR